MISTRTSPRPSNPVRQVLDATTQELEAQVYGISRKVKIGAFILAVAGLAGTFQNRDEAFYEANTRDYFTAIGNKAYVAKEGDSLHHCARHQGFSVPPAFLNHDVLPIYTSFVRSHPDNAHASIDNAGAIRAGTTVYMPAVWEPNCSPSNER